MFVSILEEKLQNPQFLQHGLGEMRTLLEHAEIGMTKKNQKAASIEAELNGLRCQVLTLRYQLDALDGTSVTAGDQPQQVSTC